MHISIEVRALKVFINILSGCRCSLSEELEKAMVEEYFASREGNYTSFDRLMKLADKMGDDTPLHRLKEFIAYNINDLGQELFITLEDVLRHFSTKFHWRVAETGLFHNYTMIKDIPSWFVGHMLLPAVLKEEDGKFMAEYVYENRIINLENVFVPSSSEVKVNDYCAVHMASVVAPLDRYDYEMIGRHLEEIRLFRLFREDLERIDYSDFQRFGDYQAIAREGHARFFKKAPAGETADSKA